MCSCQQFYRLFWREARTRPWDCSLSAYAHQALNKKKSMSANLAFVLDWHVWCDLQQVGPKKLTTAANYLIFLSFHIFEGLVSFMGGVPSGMWIQ